MNISTELLIIAILILANGFFAAAEIAILTSRRSRLEQHAQSQSRGWRVALELATHPARFLPTVQVGMTLVGTLTSVFSGATLVQHLSGKLAAAPYPLVAGNHETLALAAVVLGITFLLLVFGELVPKQLALANAENFARVVALPMRGLEIAARPAVWLMGLASGSVLTLLGRRRQGEPAVSIEDIEHLIRTGTRQGLLDPEEQMVARRALRLGDLTVREIMRPRIEIDALDVDTPPDEVIGAVAMAGFSRLPVHEGDLDHILGFVYTKDLLLRQHMGWPIELRKLVRPALLVPETLPIDRLLEAVPRRSGRRWPSCWTSSAAPRDWSRWRTCWRSWWARSTTSTAATASSRSSSATRAVGSSTPACRCTSCLQRLGKDQYRQELPPDVTTVGGLVLWVLGRIPKPGDSAAWQGLSLEVVAMDGRRLERVLVKRTSAG